MATHGNLGLGVGGRSPSCELGVEEQNKTREFPEAGAFAALLSQLK